jgi:broad specificity phosphatase PhoE
MDTMNPILFIRHAETDMAGTFCGYSDPPVNAHGQQQILDLLKSLRAESFDTIYSSDLQRAVTTAEALAMAFGASLVITAGLREIGFGQWEGLTWDEIEQKDAAQASRWVESFPYLSTPDGESVEAFHTRVLGEVQQLLALAEDRHLAVVTHAGVIRLILHSVCGFAEQEAWRSTASYCCFFKYPAEVNP